MSTVSPNNAKIDKELLDGNVDENHPSFENSELLFNLKEKVVEDKELSGRRKVEDDDMTEGDPSLRMSRSQGGSNLFRDKQLYEGEGGSLVRRKNSQGEIPDLKMSKGLSMSRHG